MTVATALAPAHAQVPPALPAMAAYAGTWSYVGGAGERQAIDRAIDRTIEGLAFFIAPIARSRLHDSNRVSSTVDVRVAPGAVSIAYDHGAPYRGPPDGTRFAARTPEGATVRCAMRFDRGHLVQVIGTDQGYRRNELVLDPDGHTLRINVTIASPFLPREMHYTLTFRR